MAYTAILEFVHILDEKPRAHYSIYLIRYGIMATRKWGGAGRARWEALHYTYILYPVFLSLLNGGKWQRGELKTNPTATGSSSLFKIPGTMSVQPAKLGREKAPDMRVAMPH